MTSTEQLSTMFTNMNISSIESSLSVVEKTNLSENLSRPEAEYFEQLLCRERDELQKLCEKWTKIQSDDIKEEDICCRINQAVGQTTMLIEEKFKQFHNMIKHSKGSGRLLITSSDLHGLWDSMYIKIKDCYSRFAYLKKLRAARWREELSPVKSVESRNKTTKKQATSRKRRSRSLPSTCGNKTTAQDDKTCEQIDNATYMCTSFVTNKRTTSVFEINNSKKCDEKESANQQESENKTRMYTSTPFGDRTIKSSNLHAPFVTMKVNQLYKKSIQILDVTDSSCSWNTTVIENTIIEKDNTLALNVNKIEEPQVKKKK
ncbi:disks large-associated protein 4-like [Pseudomyrmex gracilis]|uniref:disks large-associated protein 4-like n=1 Tax=Pseudomyrmex gracilis TaxID=219809 RepID=UPI000995A1A4|nr:disks large-associated protein 4-like [Pseudomyrmex gracilis]